MSAHDMSHHGHGDHHHEEDDGSGHSTVRGYMIGFILSVVLTVIPFWLVMGDVLGDASKTAYVILGFAAVQVVVHMIYFLHMNSQSEGGWTMLAFIFTLLILVIVMVGSLWVMHHLDTNMMPSHDMTEMMRR
ncbi:cytochrome o ubiquinol oxidase subunit IV [Verticiella sediminum]|uniref:Cytochrome bo(3) ubiquinol oxidase subunit 4 n=1 Tax=Verticiella sediminum TaxID=1247510 RepID=A0A556AS20_9BURK|nr:cytochrome o ubiquinol oxidase subunit IV [Verticiella sediminum]TSH95728.1 cytochrome o ubiquinol oxidase subunit IV [Verticiella sediminum]